MIGVTLRHYFLLMHRTEMKRLVLECEGIWDAWDERGRNEVLRYERKIRKLFLLVLGSCIFINILYPASAIVATLTAARMNDTVDTRILPYKYVIHDLFFFCDKKKE